MRGYPVLFVILILCQGCGKGNPFSIENLASSQGVFLGPSNPVPAATGADATAPKVTVCPSGCTFSNLHLALQGISDNTLVEVQKTGTSGIDYTDCGVVINNRVTIRGTGGRPVIGGRSCQSYNGEVGVLIVQGGNILVDNIELNAGNLPSNAGVVHLGDGLKLKQVKINGGETGVIRPDPRAGTIAVTDQLSIEYSTIVATTGPSLRVGSVPSFSMSHSIVSSKTFSDEAIVNATRSGIDCSQFSTNTSVSSSSLSLGGNAQISQIFLTKSSTSSGPDSILIVNSTAVTLTKSVLVDLRNPVTESTFLSTGASPSIATGSNYFVGGLRKPSFLNGDLTSQWGATAAALTAPPSLSQVPIACGVYGAQ